MPESALHRLAGAVRDQLARLLSSTTSADCVTPGESSPPTSSASTIPTSSTTRRPPGPPCVGLSTVARFRATTSSSTSAAARGGCSGSPLAATVRRVIGVEIVGEMVDFARANLEANRHRFRRPRRSSRPRTRPGLRDPRRRDRRLHFSPFGGDVFRAAIGKPWSRRWTVARADDADLRQSRGRDQVIDDCGWFSSSSRCSSPAWRRSGGRAPGSTSTRRGPSASPRRGGRHRARRRDRWLEA